MLYRIDYHPHRLCRTEAHMVGPAKRARRGLSNWRFSWDSTSLNEAHSPSKRKCIPSEDGNPSCQRCVRKGLPVSFSSLLTFMVSQRGVWILSANIEIL